jgi:hypothetical protein
VCTQAVVADGDEGNEVGDMLEETPWDSSRLKIATLNVDGLGKYPWISPGARMEGMLDALLSREPDVVLLQEVTHPMFVVVQLRLSDWSLYRVGRQEDPMGECIS